jgi:hypothetical protein
MADPTPSRVIVCGSRDGIGPGLVERALGAFDRDISNVLHLIVGSHKGVDGDAWYWALKNERPCTIVPAEWNKLGKAAGPKRNERMPELFSVHAVLAFPGGTGTANMIDVARKHHIPLWHCSVRGQHWQWMRDEQAVGRG